MIMIFNIILIISGLASAISIMMMSPKWGLWFGVSGVSGASTNEYGSKKSLEHGIKRIAIIATVVFVCTCLLYPYFYG